MKALPTSLFLPLQLRFSEIFEEPLVELMQRLKEAIIYSQYFLNKFLSDYIFPSPFPSHLFKSCLKNVFL